MNRPIPVAVETDCEPVEYLTLEHHHCRALLDERGSDGLLLCCGRERAKNEIGGYLSSYCPNHDYQYNPGRYNRRG